MSVGASSVASPLVPYLILFEVSVRVKGEPYPIAAPAAESVACTSPKPEISWALHDFRWKLQLQN